MSVVEKLSGLMKQVENQCYGNGMSKNTRVQRYAGVQR